MEQTSLIQLFKNFNTNIPHSSGVWKDFILEVFTRAGCTGRPDEMAALHSFIDNLTKTDFFTAPASTQFHGNIEQGLVMHSCTTARYLLNLIYYACSQELVTELPPLWQCLFAAFFHDLCKVDVYGVDYRNTKDEKGNWVKVPYYKTKRTPVMGHGVESAWRIRNSPVGEHILETVYEAIRWHMGTYEISDSDKYSHQEAQKTNKLVILLEMADRQAAFWDGV